MKYKIRPCCRGMVKESIRINYMNPLKREHLIQLIDDDCVIECNDVTDNVIFSHTLQIYVNLSAFYSVEDNHESSM